MSSDNLQVRPVELKEADQMLALMCRCFSLDYEIAKPIFYSDPFFDLNFKRVVIEPGSGSIISCLTIIPTTIRLGEKPSATLQIAGIAGVCTDMGYRGRGIARQLISQTILDIGTDLGFSSAALTADNPDYYRSLGWDVCGISYDWSTTDCRELAAHIDSDSVRILSIEEAAQRATELHKIYAATRGSIRGCFVRDERRWRCIERLTVGRRIAVYEFDGQILGYIAYDLRQDAKLRKVNVHEIVFLNSTAKFALLGFLASSRLARSAAGRLRLNELMDMNWRKSATFSVRAKPNLYLRATNLTMLAKQLLANSSAPPALAGYGRGFSIVIDGYANSPEAAGISACSIGSSGRKITIKPASQSSLGPTWIRGDAGAITQMMFGYKQASDLVSEGRLKTSYGRIAEICDALFPALDPFLAPPDQF